jgi:hypothetical protein
MNAKVRHHVSTTTVRPGRFRDDIVRQPARTRGREPLIGASSAQGGLSTVPLPSDQPGHPEPGLAEQQERPL